MLGGRGPSWEEKNGRKGSDGCSQYVSVWIWSFFFLLVVERSGGGWSGGRVRSGMFMYQMFSHPSPGVEKSGKSGKKRVRHTHSLSLWCGVVVESRLRC